MIYLVKRLTKYLSRISKNLQVIIELIFIIIEKKETVLIHRIVAKVYIPNPENKPNVNHIDFDPSNNAVHNLEWVTQKENVAHTHKHKRNANFEGEKSSNSKLTDKEAYEIKFRFTNFTTNKELSEIYGVGEETVRRIRKGLRWKHITFNMFND